MLRGGDMDQFGPTQVMVLYVMNRTLFNIFGFVLHL